jgi:hypothetical protein
LKYRQQISEIIFPADHEHFAAEHFHWIEGGKQNGGNYSRQNAGQNN